MKDSHLNGHDHCTSRTYASSKSQQYFKALAPVLDQLQLQMGIPCVLTAQRQLEPWRIQASVGLVPASKEAFFLLLIPFCVGR